MSLYDFRQRTHIQFGMYDQTSYATPVFSPFNNFFNAMMMRFTSCFNPFIRQNSGINPLLTTGGTTGIFYNQVNMPTFNNTPYIPTYIGTTPTYQSLGLGDCFVPRSMSSNFYANTSALNNSYVSGFVPATTVQSNSPATYTNTQYGSKDLNFWKNLGYNPERGQQMVNYIKSETRGKNVSGQCGQVVRHAINSTYYGGAMHYEQFNKACNTGDEFLSKDGNFKKYVPTGEISAADIPPGAIIIYRGDTGDGKKGYVKNDPRGHIAVAVGDGEHDESNRYAKIRTECIKEIWLPA